MSEIFLCGGAADATVLSNVFIDEYLKDANDAQLKVYLFLVRRLQAGDPVSISDMATALIIRKRTFCAPSATGKSAAS